MRVKRRKSRVRRGGVQQESLHHVPHAIDLQRAIKTGHYTPDTVIALQGVAGNQAMLQRAPKGAEPPTAAKEQSEAEKRLKEIIASLKGAKKKDNDQYQKALIEALKAFMKTDLGKQIKSKARKNAFTADGLPVTILVASGLIGGLFASNAGIPGIPDIPLSDDLSLTLELDGTMQEPTGIKFSFKYTFGGKAKPEKKNPTADPKKLSPEMLKAIQDIDSRLISKWIVARAYWEYEMSGPDEEAAKKKRYNELKANSSGLPDAQIVSEKLVEKLIEKVGEKRIEFPLDHGNNDVWNLFYELKGFEKVLEQIVMTIVPLLPPEAQAIEEITFKFGRQEPIKIEVEHEKEKEKED
jgi:hypothetical protein